MKKIFFLLTMAFLFAGCCLIDDDIPENTFLISQTPVNIRTLNSKYDDYNSDLDYLKDRRIIFSSNRNSKGKDFDIIYKNLLFEENQETKNVTIKVAEFDIPGYWKKILRNINTSGNEFGPYFNGAGGNLFLMYSTENSSGYDIQFLNLTDWYSALYKNFDSIPKTIKKINDFGDDLYPAFSKDKKNLIFCSNKNSSVFNIYNASFGKEINLELLLNSDIQTIDKIESLSSIAEDKCPFIGEDGMMVFSSNREGGFGGYDLWYSFYKNGEWTNPENFGSKINTKKDEFRPITFKIFGRNLMIFSSNRKGGLGGFDLYGVEY